MAGFYSFLEWVVEGHTPSEIRDYLRQNRSELSQPNQDGVTIWHQVTHRNLLSMLRHLQVAGYDGSDTVDQKGNTAIHYLTSDPRYRTNFGDMLDLLLELGVDINAVNSEGHSALCGVCETKNVEYLEIMLGRGAILRPKGQKKSLICCAIAGQFTEMVRRLIMLDSSLINDVHEVNRTYPIDSAIGARNVHMVTLMCEAGYRPASEAYRYSLNLAMNQDINLLIPLLRNASVDDITCRPNGMGSAIYKAILILPEGAKFMLAIFPGLKIPELTETCFIRQEKSYVPTDEERRDILYQVFFARSLIDRLVPWV